MHGSQKGFIVYHYSSDMKYSFWIISTCLLFTFLLITTLEKNVLAAVINCVGVGYCIGTDKQDYMIGDAKNNNMSGLGGIDLMVGNAANDVMSGNADNDTMHGNAGSDTIMGDGGTDVIEGMDGNDNLSGNDGDDFVRGWNGNDIVNGNAGNDDVRGSPGADVINGGSGNDRIAQNMVVFSNIPIDPDGSKDTIDCGPGYDEAWISSADLDTQINCETVHYN